MGGSNAKMTGSHGPPPAPRDPPTLVSVTSCNTPPLDLGRSWQLTARERTLARATSCDFWGERHHDRDLRRVLSVWLLLGLLPLEESWLPCCPLSRGRAWSPHTASSDLRPAGSSVSQLGAKSFPSRALRSPQAVTLTAVRGQELRNRLSHSLMPGLQEVGDRARA